MSVSTYPEFITELSPVYCCLVLSTFKVKDVKFILADQSHLSRNCGDVPLPPSLPWLSTSQPTKHRHLAIPWFDVPKLLRQLLRWRFAYNVHLVIVFSKQRWYRAYHPSDWVFKLSAPLILLNNQTMRHLVWDGDTSTKV